jgi:sugar lactone lactonase YvrE
MACINAALWSQRGGLDGINVDACGTVYVTEFVQGLVWRYDPGAPEATIAASLPSQWIPNMHWGVAGAWDPMTLYVSDRDQGRIFGLPLGRPGKHTTVSW